MAIKTIEKCRELQAPAIAMLPLQTQQRFQGMYREQDSLNARLYLGKITIGEYNVGINRIVTEEMKAFYGAVRPESSDVGSKQDDIKGPAPSLVQPQAQTAITQPQQTRLALVIGNSNYTELPKLSRLSMRLDAATSLCGSAPRRRTRWRQCRSKPPPSRTSAAS
jgi:hypothetical protein